MNNQLALSIGYGELLTRSPRLPDDLRLQAEQALRGAEEAADTLAQLCRIACTDAEQRVTPAGAHSLEPLGPPIPEVLPEAPMVAAHARRSSSGPAQ